MTTTSAPARRAPTPRSPAPRGASAGAPPPVRRGPLRRARPWADAALGGPLPAPLARWDSPATTWYVITGATGLLVGLGLVMVLSSSSVEAYAASDGSSGATVAPALKQAAFAVVGVAAAWALSRVPTGWWRRPLLLPLAAVLASVGLQLLVFTPLGVDVNGNRNWVGVGSMTVQPSEFVKLASVVWCAAVLTHNRTRLHRFTPAVLPVLVGTGPGLALVVAGRDLGTAMVLALVVGAAMFVAGVRAVHLAALALPVLVGVAALAVTSPNRLARITSFLGGSADSQGLGWQSVHSRYALASGGLSGLGLGASREKWSWLPEAHNDFIFAVIGEELGLLGTLSVVFLFVALAWGCARTLRASGEVLVKVGVGAVMAWLLGQAVVNIGVVVGLLPVLGVPLPLISAGGSALVASLAAVGLVLGGVRSLPGASLSLGARPSLVRSTLAVVTARRGPDDRPDRPAPREDRRGAGTRPGRAAPAASRARPAPAGRR